MRCHKFDFAEIDFWVQGKINNDIHKNFENNYSNWRAEIREILEEYCPKLSEKSKEYLPYALVSILEGATIQYFISKKDFNIDGYFDYCKEMMLGQIYAASNLEKVAE